jgi:hypothetical protein
MKLGAARQHRRSSRASLTGAHISAVSRRRRPSFAVRFALIEKKGRGEGRAPAGTQGPHAKNARGVTTGDAGTSRPSLRNGFTAYGALSPGSDALLPPSPCGSQMRAPGRATRTTASLDAQTPGVRTTRFCRPRTSRPGHPEARACSPPKPKGDAVTAPCRSRGSRWLTGVARPAIPSRAGAAASIASRPAYRDDRETPLWRAGMFCGLPEETNSVNQNICGSLP